MSFTRFNSHSSYHSMLQCSPSIFIPSLFSLSISSNVLPRQLFSSWWTSLPVECKKSVYFTNVINIILTFLLYSYFILWQLVSENEYDLRVQSPTCHHKRESPAGSDIKCYLYLRRKYFWCTDFSKGWHVYCNSCLNNSNTIYAHITTE